MSRTSLGDMLASIAERGRNLIGVRRAPPGMDKLSLEALLRCVRAYVSVRARSSACAARVPPRACVPPSPQRAPRLRQSRGMERLRQAAGHGV